MFRLEEIEQETAGASLTAKLFGIACRHSSLHIDLIIDIDRAWRNVVTDYLVLLDDLDIVFPALSALAKGVDVDGQSDSIRRWRECDNFVQNYTACHLALNEFREQMAPEELERAVVLGLGYGGLEMPCLSTAVASRQGREIDAGMCDLSIYHDKAVGAQIRSGRYEDVRARLTAERKVFVGDRAHTRWSSDWRSRSVILADDNCTTGVSLQLARDVFVLRGADVVGAIVCRFPGANRHVQMSIPGHGFPDPEMLFSFIRGLVSPSPYTRLLYPSPGENPYLDYSAPRLAGA